jgi:Hydrazine synthase alpha subunit middle domain
MAQAYALRLLRAALVSAILGTLLAGCGGGSGSSSSGLLGGGQDPDPAVLDFPVAYVRRPLLLDDMGALQTFEVRDPTAFMPGAELFVRDRASPSAMETNVTANVFPDDAIGNPPLYDVKDLSSSFDGQQLVFAMRAPEIPNADDDEQPTWNIWVYDVPAKSLRRVIASDITAEIGQDVAPHFLPDGRIVFASTRQRDAKAVLLDEGKPQFAAQEEDRQEDALSLHVMDADGSNIHQISFNQSHDMDPSVLADGRIVYARWDNIANNDAFSLYTMNPDGTEQKVLYGIHSHDTGPNGEQIEFVEPQELPDGRILVTMRPSVPESHLGAALVAIDTANYVDHDQPTFASQGLTADAQELLVPGDIQLDAVPSPRGRFASVAPLYDASDRLLVTWSQCRLLDPASDPLKPTIVPCTDALLAVPGIEEAPPLYGVWMFDVRSGTQQPLVTPKEGFAYTEAIVMEYRTPPVVRLDKVAGLDFDPDLVSENVGELHIRSVYDFDGTASAPIDSLRDPAQTTAAQRPARFLRIIKAVSIPDRDLVDLDGADFGVSQAQLMREIIGYAPIEPDGSVKLKVPANIAFGVEVLDSNGQRISQRHQNWLTLRPGEVIECNGCHTRTSEKPHGRPDAEAPSVNLGAPADGLPFPNTEPALFADTGETMAETYTRLHGVPTPNVDIRYDDVWTDPNVRAKDASFDYSYAALKSPAPVDGGCVTSWNASCRIVINYEAIIHPIWGVPRVLADGVTDVTCNTCHSPTDAAAAAQVPAAQLDLSDGVSPDEADQLNSYRELLFSDNEQELLNGVLVDRLVQATDANGNPLFQTDGNGNPILDANGQPIPVLVNVTSSPPLSPAGALASPRFFSRFAPGGTHAGWLTPAELKLISEWLDIGAQNFNDPFAVPQA